MITAHFNSPNLKNIMLYKSDLMSNAKKSVEKDFCKLMNNANIDSCKLTAFYNENKEVKQIFTCPVTMKEQMNRNTMKKL